MKLEGSNLLGREKISRLIHNDLNYVWFPKKLEQNYRQQYQNEAAREFRYRGPIILMLYFFLSFGIYQFLQPDEVRDWIMLYGWVGVIIFVAWIFSWFDAMHQYFDWYTCIGSSLAVAISFAMTSVLDQGQSSILYHAAMMYAVVIIYGFVGMRFYLAMLAGWSGGVLGLLASSYMGTPVEWALLNRTYTFSSFLGMCLVYVTDRQHRENYLQSCLIEITRLEMVVQAQQLEILSRQDALTGLANRRYLDEILRKEWNRAMRHENPLTVMMIDIDYFKAYNDSLGHLAGDYCLKKIADTIASVAARSGDLAARYGGEEFFLIFAMNDDAQAIMQAERLLGLIEALDIPHPTSPVSQSVTLSIGIATLTPQLNDQMSEFVASADHALYMAKATGRNRYVVAEKVGSAKSVLNVV